LTQLIWICSNLVWASGEIFYVNVSDAPIFLTYQESSWSFRWVASWIVCSGCIPLLLVYFIWIRATIAPMKQYPQNQKLELVNKDDHFEADLEVVQELQEKQ
jgi:hypothetical protein